MARPPSDADRDFSKRLQVLGSDATPERVQTLREVGLLPAPTLTFPGGGGSTGRYPTELVERAREGLDLAQEHHRELHVAVAIMYARGKYSISENKLKRALLRVLDRHKRQLLGATDAHEKREARSPDETAINAGVVLAKRLGRDPAFGEQRRRIPRSKDRPKQAVLETVGTAVVQAQLTGEALPAEAVGEMFRILGASTAFSKTLIDELVEQPDAENFSHFRLDDIAAALKQAELEQLEGARDDALAQMESYRTVAASFPYAYASANGSTLDFPISDETTLFAALTNLSAMFNDPDRYRRDIAHVRHMTSFLDALVHLAKSLPAEFKPMVYFDDTLHEEELTTGQRQRLKGLKAEYVQQHPAQARVLGVQLR